MGSSQNCLWVCPGPHTQCLISRPHLRWVIPMSTLEQNHYSKCLIQLNPPAMGGGELPSHFTIPLLYFLNAPNQTAHFPQEMSKFPTSAYVAPSCLPYFCLSEILVIRQSPFQMPASFMESILMFLKVDQEHTWNIICIFSGSSCSLLSYSHLYMYLPH